VVEHGGDSRATCSGRENLANAALLPVVPPSAGEQRLSDLYRKKGLQALIEELKKFSGLRTG